MDTYYLTWHHGACAFVFLCSFVGIWLQILVHTSHRIALGLMIQKFHLAQCALWRQGSLLLGFYIMEIGALQPKLCIWKETKLNRYYSYNV